MATVLVYRKGRADADGMDGTWAGTAARLRSGTYGVQYFISLEL